MKVLKPIYPLITETLKAGLFNKLRGALNDKTPLNI